MRPETARHQDYEDAWVPVSSFDFSHWTNSGLGSPETYLEEGTSELRPKGDLVLVRQRKGRSGHWFDV